MDKDDIKWKLRSYEDTTPILIRVNGVVFDIDSIDYDENLEAIVLTAIPEYKGRKHGNG